MAGLEVGAGGGRGVDGDGGFGGWGRRADEVIITACGNNMTLA